jgi:hypothetical protein
MATSVDREPFELDAFSEQLQKHVEEDAPQKMRMMAAQGMAPAQPAETARLLYQLHFDESEQVREAVNDAIADMPANVLVNVAQKSDSTGLLDWLAERRGEEEQLVEVMLRNEAAHDLTFARLAGHADQRIAEMIATNEVRILRTPRIIEQLYQNPATRMSTVDRLIELAQRNDVSLDGLPGLKRALKQKPELFGSEADKEDADEEFQKILEREAETSAEEQELLEKLEDEDLTRSQKEEIREKIEEKQSERRELGPAALIQMTVPEKIRLATVGSRSTIKKLAQDPNRLVHMAAIESPQLKTPDVVRMASKKSMPDDVISFIANNREWTQKYELVRNLLFNPKTPVSDSMDLMKRLRNNDLKQLSRSREVPHQVSRAADRLYKKRTGGGDGGRGR